VISIKEIFEVIRKRVFTIISFMLFGLIIASTYLYVEDPLYRAEVLMVPVHDDQQSSAQSMISQIGGLTGLGDFASEKSMTTESYLSLLHSREFLLNFVNGREVRKHIFPDLYDEVGEVWTGEPPSLLKTHDHLVKRVISYTFDKKTNLVRFYVTLSDPHLAAIWANDLIDELNKFARESDIKEAELSKEFLLEELNRTSLVNPQNMLNDLIEKQIQTIMLANVKEGYVFRVLDKAFTPESQSYPRPLLTIVLSVISFMFISIFYLVALHTQIRQEENL